MRVYIATTNAGKVREMRAISAPFGWDVLVFDGYREPVEGETSYGENAALKARALARQLTSAGIACANVVADDSGLEVEALGGRPGVLSARFGGADATWAQRRRAVLDALSATGSSNRSARFMCAMHFVAADGSEASAEGTVAGEIAECERGEGGFSYDAIFYYEPLRRTFAELGEAEKNAVSHRTLAARALNAQLGMGQ